MFGLQFLFTTGLCVTMGEPRYGTIINFEPPDLNDWVEKVLVKDTDIIARHKSGKIVTDSKLALFSMRLEQYCYESNEIPHITQLQWYNPPKPECKVQRYHVVKLLYNDFTIDCLRMATYDRHEALESIKPIVIKRFYLKVYYLTTTGNCYLKYFELPVRECSADGHIKVPSEKCEELFLFLSDIFESSDDDDDISVKTF